MLNAGYSGLAPSPQDLTKKQKRAAYMRAYNQAKGGIAVKGIAINCELCGCSTEKRHFAHNWCAACTPDGQRLRKNERRALNGAESVGTEKTCKHCGAAFRKEHKRQFYCRSCSTLASAEALPAYRARQLEYQKERNKRRRREIPAVAISGRMSAGISSSLKDGKGGRSWEALVGFTVVDLMAHLERQFLPGMSWGNRGEWHIDHIRPLCSFEFLTPECPQFREAWALSNLRPLWAADNIRKGGRRDLLL